MKDDIAVGIAMGNRTHDFAQELIGWVRGESEFVCTTVTSEW